MFFYLKSDLLIPEEKDGDLPPVVGGGGVQLESNAGKINPRRWRVVRLVGTIHDVAVKEGEGERRINFYSLGKNTAGGGRRPTAEVKPTTAVTKRM